MKRLRNYIIPFLFCVLSTNINAQDFFEKWGNRLFYRTLKHEIWRPYFDLDTLSKNDTIYIWSRHANRKIARTGEGIYIRKHNGDIWFRRNGKILKRTYSKANGNKTGNGTNKLSLEWVEYGKWHKENGLLIIEIGDYYSSLEWVEQTRDVIDLRVVDAYKKSSH